MNGKEKILKHVYRNSSGPNDGLVIQQKFTGSAADMATIRAAGAGFTVNIDGSTTTVFTLANDGVSVGLDNDAKPRRIEFAIGGIVKFTSGSVVASATQAIPFSLSGGTASTGETVRPAISLRGQSQRVVSFRAGDQAPVQPAQMGTGGDYTTDSITLPVGVETRIVITYADGSTKVAAVTPRAGDRELELRAQESGLAVNTPRCSVSPEVLQQLGLDASAICHGNKITMSNGAVYRVVVEGDSARLVLEAKEDSLIESLALPAALVAGGGALIWYGMKQRKLAEAKQNPGTGRKK